LRTKTSFGQLTYLVKRFPCLLPKDYSLDELELGFSGFQTCELPDYETTQLRIDHMWIEVRKMKDEAGVSMFKNICILTCLVYYYYCIKEVMGHCHTIQTQSHLARQVCNYSLQIHDNLCKLVSLECIISHYIQYIVVYY